MGHPNYRTCKGCGVRVDPPESLSWTRLCVACGDARRRGNFDAMKTMRGPYAEHWSRRVLLDAHRRLVAIRRDAP